MSPTEQEIRAVCEALARAAMPDAVQEMDDVDAFAWRTAAYAFYRPYALAAIGALQGAALRKSPGLNSNSHLSLVQNP